MRGLGREPLWGHLPALGHILGTWMLLEMNYSAGMILHRTSRPSKSGHDKRDFIAPNKARTHCEIRSAEGYNSPRYDRKDATSDRARSIGHGT